MSPSTDWRSEYFQLIADCRKRDHMLSAWDADFLDSIEDRLNQMRTLSLKQSEKLDEIWAKATSRG